MKFGTLYSYKSHLNLFIIYYIDIYIYIYITYMIKLSNLHPQLLSLSFQCQAPISKLICTHIGKYI